MSQQVWTQKIPVHLRTKGFITNEKIRKPRKKITKRPKYYFRNTRYPRRMPKEPQISWIQKKKRKSQMNQDQSSIYLNQNNKQKQKQEQNQKSLHTIIDDNSQSKLQKKTSKKRLLPDQWNQQQLQSQKKMMQQAQKKEQQYHKQDQKRYKEHFYHLFQDEELSQVDPMILERQPLHGKEVKLPNKKRIIPISKKIPIPNRIPTRTIHYRKRPMFHQSLQKTLTVSSPQSSSESE